MDHPIPPQTITTSGGDTDTGPKDPTTIIKGKRTKRQRPTTILTHSSTVINPYPISSLTSSSDFPASSTTTEDEDTANCLILLSRGHNVYTMNGYNNNNNNNIEGSSNHKFNSKKYIQTSTDEVNGLTGTYVYECQTCSRTFTSFQALGGHRASHKKPKTDEFNKQKPKPKTPSYMAFLEHPSQFQTRKNCSSSSSTLSLQISNRVSFKLHECSICGAEFNSGQALGGHMRRHRGSTTTVSAAHTTLSLVPYKTITTMVVDDRDYQKSTADGLCMDLDLNLPASPELTMAMTVADQDQQHESSYQQHTVDHLSTAPTLVDCYY